MKPTVNEINQCEVCGNESLSSVLDLGEHPMCDDLVPVGNEWVCNEYPIHILYCATCRTAHQKYQVPKQNLFPQNYHYRSRFTADVLNGMKDLVKKCEDLVSSLAGLKVVDVGCNDGSLLSFFREKGAITIGVEPTRACEDAENQGHIVYNSFLTPELASEITTDYGKPDLIVFTNVFAHIEDLGMVLESLQSLLSPNTVLIIENHYLGTVLNGNQFDTFYHEHPRTYSCTSFIHIARSLRLSVINVEFPKRYGGNIRVFLGQQDQHKIVTSARIQSFLEQEDTFEKQFEIMRKNIESWQNHKRKEIEALVVKNGKIAAKAFPGRAAILVKLLKLDTSLISVVYEKPGSLKIGHYLPGTQIPIVSDDDLFSSTNLSQPILNLAWHISEEIHNYMRIRGYVGLIIDILSPNDFV